MHPIDPRIFRAYDIRGTALTQLTVDAARRIAHGFGSVLRERISGRMPRVCVGRDARTHGPQLERAVIDGLMAAGCDVFTIGATPSPLSYFTVCNAPFDGGIQVTASHNPAPDNGLKLCTENAHAYAGDDLQDLHIRITQERFAQGTGTVQPYDGTRPYLEAIQKRFSGALEGMNIVVDSGNGIAGPVYCRALRAAGAIVTELYTEPDGTFPNHAADPSKHATLRELQETVQREQADLGFGFDGDGDRMGLVDETGAIRTPDEILLLLAQDVLRRHPGSPIVFTVSNSGILETEITRLGGTPIMCKVGHSFVEHAMQEHGALVGGEQSGHFFCFEDYFGFDDALVAALHVAAIVQRSKEPVSAAMSRFPRVYQAPERRPAVPDDRKWDIVSAVEKHFSATHPVITLDGVRIDFGNGAWAGIRASNTSPCISICIEARSPEQLKSVEETVLTHLRTYPDIEWQSEH